MRRFPFLSRCSATFSPNETQMVSRHRFDGSAKPVIRYRKVQAGVHSVCSPVSDLRRACSLLLADDLPAPSAHTCERVEPSDSCHVCAWHHHLLSDRSGVLSPPYAGTGGAGGVRDRGFRKGADGGSPVTYDGRPAGGMQMSATAGAITRRPAHPMDTISGGPIGPSAKYPRGVWYGSQGPQQIVIGRSPRRHAAAVHSTRFVSFFQSALEPARAADTATAPGLTDPLVAVAVSNYGCPVCGRADWNCRDADCPNRSRSSNCDRASGLDRRAA